MASETCYYSMLGVSRTASGTEIKKAYQKLCKTRHPDRGGDPEDFKTLKKAAETLQDDELRAIYDKHGEAGLDRHANGGHPGGGGMDLNDILRNMMGGGGGGSSSRGPKGPPKGDSMQFRLLVSLTDLYCGKVQNIPLQRKELCSGCEGTGATKGGKATTCVPCRGQGVRIVVRQMGHIMQQFRTACPDCEGEGRCIDKKFRCKACNGQRLVVKERTIPVEIPPGAADGEKIVLSGESHQEPDGVPGDIIVFLKQESSSGPFERHGDDLLYKQKISLAEAICGYRFNITHMDGRVLTVSSEPGSVVSPGGYQLVHDEGMPRRQNKVLRGTLFIQFEIEFPTSAQITPELRQELTKFLPPLPPVEEHEPVVAVPFNPARDPALGASERGNSGATHHGDSDDDHHHGGGGGATCVQQ